MNLLYVTDAKYFKNLEGKIFTKGKENFDYFSKFLNCFNKVYVLARVRNTLDINNDLYIANGINVIFIEIPTKNFVVDKKIIDFFIFKNIKKIFKNIDRVLLKVPGMVSGSVGKYLIKNKINFSIHAVGDPWESLSIESIGIVKSFFARKMYTKSMILLCKNATNLAYVTSNYLQSRYRFNNNAYVTSFSDVNLEDFLFEYNLENIERKFKFNKNKNDLIKLVNIGSMQTAYKCQEEQIKALDLCLKNGINIEMHFIGDGILKNRFIQLAKELKLEKRVNFHGQVIGIKNIINIIDECDLYLMPSKTEALPRALIEAMSRALPCIATDVGGIPELIDSEFLLENSNEKLIYEKIKYILKDKNFMRNQSKINFEKACLFKKSNMDNKFYEFIEKIIEKGL